MNKIFPERCAVLDLETTGNQADRGDQIIQIGICILEQGELVDTYTTLVKPTKGIPAFIQKLTGITNEDVQDAPSIAEVIPEVIKKLEEAALIGHNIHFDLGFLQYTLEDLGYAPFSGFIFDTVEMARFLLPKQRGYRLEQLAEDFNIEHTAHQADSDAWATAQLFKILIRKLKTLPLVTIQRLIPLARSLFSDIEILLRRVEREKLSNSQMTMDASEYFVYRQLALRMGETKVIEELTPDWSPERFTNLTFIHHALANQLPNYERRLAQEKLSQFILKAFEQEKHALYEAGTGTGKTLAYLLSALFWAKERGEKVVISTYTLLLQNQIITNELPILKKACSFPFSIQILKGRNHYLCLRKFESLLFNEVDHNYDFVLTKMKLLVWITLTETGDVEEINLPTGGKEYWQMVQSESRSCLKRRCPWHKYCYYYKARDKAERADLIVTNHALLLADAQHEHPTLPEHQYVIIDEAHHLEYIASEQYGHHSAYKAIQSLINRLTVTEKHNLTQQLLDILPLITTDDLSLDINEIARLAEELKIATADLFTSLVDFAEEQEIGYIEGNIRQVSIHDQDQDTNRLWQEIIAQVEQLGVLLQNIKRHKEQFLRHIEHKAVLSTVASSLIIDWSGIIEHIALEFAKLDAYFFPEQPEQQIRWIEYEHKGAKNSATLVMRPLEVGSKIQKELFKQKKSVVLTSATLQISNSFEYMANELGLPLDTILTCQLSSPFNYHEQAILLIPDYITKPGDGEENDFLQEIAEEIVDLAILTEGKMLVLFTSYHSLRFSYRLMKDELSAHGIHCFAQGIDSGSRGRLTKNFQREEKAVLLGTTSFWEGVDIPGEDLSCLIIVKLPFAPPQTPFNQAKLTALKASGKNPFKDYSIPQAIIRFKQGFGRLIRRQTDKGVIIVFDRRMMEANYGKLFLDSLPQIEIEQLSKPELHQRVKDWLG